MKKTALFNFDPRIEVNSSREQTRVQKQYIVRMDPYVVIKFVRHIRLFFHPCY